MADRTLRTNANVGGKYYVDSNCVHCELCQTLAEEYFATTTEGEGYVYRQPKNLQEVELCDLAKKSCPVNAIGDDGDSA